MKAKLEGSCTRSTSNPPEKPDKPGVTSSDQRPRGDPGLTLAARAGLGASQPRGGAVSPEDPRSAVPNCLGTKGSFVEDSFSVDRVGVGVGRVGVGRVGVGRVGVGRVGVGRALLGRFKHVTFIVNFVSVVVLSAPPPIIKQQTLEVGDLCSRRSSALP